MLRRLAAIAVCVAVAAIAAASAAVAAPRAEVDWAGVQRESAALLSRYIRIRSVNPPADTREAAALLRGVLEAEGIAVVTFEPAPGRVSLVARLEAAEAQLRPLMLLHHMDVVPVDPSRWREDPFSGAVRDGFLHGRGTADMKGVGVIHVMTLIALKRQKIPLARDVILTATADEETGGEWGARWLIANQWDRLNPEYILDEGGFGARDVLAADGRLVFGISVAEKKMLWLRVTVEGTAGHGSQPMADNANVLLARTLAAIAGRVSADSGGAVIREMSARIGEMADNKFTRAIRRDTVSVTTLRSGVGDPPKVNVIPSTAEATLDCRLLPDTDPDRFLEELKALVPDRDRIDFTIEYRVDETPVTPHQTPVFAALEKAIVKEHPGATVTPIHIPYRTDTNAFRAKGAMAYGLVPMMLDASIVASMHSDAERIPVAELSRGVRILYNAIADCCARR